MLSSLWSSPSPPCSLADVSSSKASEASATDRAASFSESFRWISRAGEVWECDLCFQFRLNDTLVQESLHNIGDLIKSEVPDQRLEGPSVLLDDLSNLFRFPNLSVGTSKYSTVGEEDPPPVCRWIGHWQRLEDVWSDTTWIILECTRFR